MVPSYLQFSLANLAKEQERFAKQFGAALTPAGAFEAFQDQARKNVAMFEQVMTNAMTMFKPFNGPLGGPLGGRRGLGLMRRPAAGSEAAQPTPARRRKAQPGSRARPRRRAMPRLNKHAARSDDLAEMKAQMAAMQAISKNSPSSAEGSPCRSNRRGSPQRRDRPLSGRHFLSAG